MRVFIKPHQNSIQAAVRGTWWLRHVSAVELVSSAEEPDKAKKTSFKPHQKWYYYSSNKMRVLIKPHQNSIQAGSGVWHVATGARQRG